jgi:hypothetical protein
MRGAERRLLCAGVAVAVCLAVAPSGADDGRRVTSGAVGVGANGSFASVEGASSGSAGLEVASYQMTSGVILRYAASADFMHVSDLDQLGIEGHVGVMRGVGRSSAYPFVALSAGVRQEWVGSFRHSRFPLGIDVGMMILASNTAALDVAYEFRRLVDDPVSDFNEHRLTLGVSILFRNQ